MSDLSYGRCVGMTDVGKLMAEQVETCLVSRKFRVSVADRLGSVLFGSVRFG